MRCVILAAGMATRLGELTKGLPKCLLPIGGKPILQRIIENVAASGIEQIGVVIGYNAEAIRAFVKRHFPYLRIRFIVNPRYESTNNAFSLLMAREFFMHDARQGNPVYGLLLLDADIVFPQSLLPEFLAHKATDKIAVRRSESSSTQTASSGKLERRFLWLRHMVSRSALRLFHRKQLAVSSMK
jgi:choline kinase